MSHQGQPRRTFTAGALAILALAAGAALPLPALGQNRPGGGGDSGGPPGAGPGGFVVRGGGGFGRVDPLAGVKAQINASDEEWKVIGPKLRAVVAAQQVVEADPTESLGMQDVRRGGGPGGGGNGAFAGPVGAGGPRGGGPGGWGGGGPGGPGGGGGPGGNGPGGNRPDGGPPGGGGGGAPSGGFPGGQGRPAGFGGGGWPGGPGGGPFGRTSPIALAQADLKTALDDPQSSPQEIQEKVAAVRRATQQARADLAAARRELVELLTADQQLVLVGLGYLE
jgi:hypothetical protein